jgi:hypothetical protein
MAKFCPIWSHCLFGSSVKGVKYISLSLTLLPDKQCDQIGQNFAIWLLYIWRFLNFDISKQF